MDKEYLVLFFVRESWSNTLAIVILLRNLSKCLITVIYRIYRNGHREILDAVRSEDKCNIIALAYLSDYYIYCFFDYLLHPICLPKQIGSRFLLLTKTIIIMDRLRVMFRHLFLARYSTCASNICTTYSSSSKDNFSLPRLWWTHSADEFSPSRLAWETNPICFGLRNPRSRVVRSFTLIIQSALERFPFAYQ